MRRRRARGGPAGRAADGRLRAERRSIDTQAGTYQVDFSLVGAIPFHINLTSQVPPVAYLTVADKCMIANCVGLIGALAARSC